MLFPLHRTSCASGDQDSTIYLPVSKGFAVLWAIPGPLHRWTGRQVLTPGRDASGFFITAAIGTVGSLLATYGGQALGLYNAGEPAGFFGSVIGAIIVLTIYSPASPGRRLSAADAA